MSSHLLRLEDIAYLVEAGYQHAPLIRIRDPYETPLTWWHNGQRYAFTDQTGRLDEEKTPEEVGQMLWTENNASVKNDLPAWKQQAPRYDKHVVPVKETAEWAPRIPQTHLQILKMIQYYEYQTGSSENWSNSEAKAYTDALLHATIDSLPHMDEASWGAPANWTAELSPPQEINHPDLTWAKNTLRQAKGDRITEEELDSVKWYGLLGCYMCGWRGMMLGIETDGHIHS